MEARGLAAQQLYPPEPPPSFPPPAVRVVLSDQRYPPEPPPSFPPLSDLADQQNPLDDTPPALPLLDDVDARGLRAETNALTAEDLSRLSVGHAKTLQIVDPTQLYTTACLLVAVVGVIFFVVLRRKDTVTTKKPDAHGRSVVFTDSYEPFLG